MRPTRLSCLLAALLCSCSDGSTPNGGPRAGEEDVPRRVIPTDLDGPPQDVPAADGGAGAADGTVAACLAANGITAGRRAQTDAQGRAALYDRATSAYVVLVALDAADRPLAGADLQLAVGAETWTAMVTAERQMPTLVNAARGPDPMAFGLDAKAQLHGGVAAAEGRTPTVSPPDCLEPSLTIELHSRHIPVARGVARLVTAPWIDERCDSAEWAPSCAPLEGFEARIDADATPGLVVRADANAVLGDLRGLAGLEDDWGALRAASCADALGAALVSWVEPGVAAALLARFRVVGQRLQLLLLRLSRDPPPDPASAGVAVADALAPLAQVAWLLRFGGLDVHAPGRGDAFARRNALVGAADAVKAYTAGLDLGLDLDAPYDWLLLDGEPKPIDGLAFRLSDRPGLGDGVDCSYAVVTDLTARPGPTIAVATAIAHMLDVLDAGATLIERSHWPVPPDVGPPDAGPPPDAGMDPPDGGVDPPDMAAPAPDMFVPMGPECVADDEEPNPDWMPLVARRHPPGGGNLQNLTLMPGDDDWYVFETGNFSVNVRATVAPSDHCAGDRDQRICLDLWQWGWVYEEALLDGGPDHLRGPFCGPASQMLASGQFGIRGLLGEPWIAILVHVYREDDGPNPAAYQLSFVH